ncbi:MAG: radical SAM protein, partial [bacterium]
RLRSVKKFKVQFARMGEPALNSAVLDVLRALPGRFDAPGLIPCIATVAPRSAVEWFEGLMRVRREVYGGRPFQLQLSINSTDDAERDRLMPVPKMSFAELGSYAQRFASFGPRKVGLNFALTGGVRLDPHVVAQHFDPRSACIKITPLNPTYRSRESGLLNGLAQKAPDRAQRIVDEFMGLGFDVILSIGDARENAIGSNCGMAVRKLRSNAA